MSEWFDEWEAPPEFQPDPADYGFDLDRALSSVLAVTARIPQDAFTAETLGVERAGNGVLVREDGVVLTIGYLITEAEHIALTTIDGRTVAGHALDYDSASGLGLVQALGDLGQPALPIGDSRHAGVGERVRPPAPATTTRSVAAQIVARQEFAGYWEYALDEAIFTAPAHPHWGGAALIGSAGQLLGVGSLQLQHRTPRGRVEPLNMVAPIELLPPLDDLLSGKVTRTARPWLGVYCQELDEVVTVIGFAGDGPAHRAGLREGDGILAVAGMEVTNLADFYRAIWALGEAGVDAPLTLNREGDVFDVRVTTRDRRKFLKTPRLH